MSNSRLKTEKLQETEGRINGLMVEALQNAEQAQQHGIRAMASLDHQEEQLDGAEDTLDSNLYVLEKSRRALRGMTWGGSIYNWFAGEPEKPSCSSSSSSSALGISSTGNSNTSRSAPLPSVVQGAASYSTPASSSSSSAPIARAASAPLSSTDADDELLLKSVETLRELSVGLGEKIEAQNSKVASIEGVLERTEDSTMQVTVKTAQLTQRSSKASEVPIGDYRLVDTHSGRFLAVEGDDLVLAPVTKPDRSSLFRVFQKEGHIMGLMSLKTQKWLGLTWLGDVKCSGDYFGKSEECHIELSGTKTGIYMCACNWYGGGWLKVPNSGAVKVMLECSSGLTDKAGILTVKAHAVVPDAQRMAVRDAALQGLDK